MDQMAVIERYFVHMTNGDAAAVASLFMEDATLATPDGREFTGRPAIGAMYAALLAAQRPLPHRVAQVMGERAVAFEIEGRLPDGTPTKTANFFFFTEDGLIQRVSAYRRDIRSEQT